MNHKWEYVTFSTHHGWESPEYICANCGRSWKSDDPAPKGPCLLASKDPEDPDGIIIFFEGKEYWLTLKRAKRLARAILQIGNKQQLTKKGRK